MTTLHIMHVPGADEIRDANVARLHRDAPGRVCVHADRERRGAGPTFGAALSCSLFDPGDWSVILQDDAEPAADTWIDELEQCLQYAPWPGLMPMTFFCSESTDRTRHGIEAGTPYVHSKPGFIATTALAINRQVRKPLAAAYPLLSTYAKADDNPVTVWALIARCPVVHPVRSPFTTGRAQSLLGHSKNQAAYLPAHTIADPGPAWNHNPRSIEVAPLPVGPSHRSLAKRFRKDIA